MVLAYPAVGLNVLGYNDDKCARIISFNHDDLEYLLKRKDHESNNDELD